MIADWLEVSPPLNSTLRRYMLEPVDMLIRVQTPYPPETVRVQAWTNLPTPENSDGDWYAVDIPYVGSSSDGSFMFQRSLRPTSQGDFELTYRMYPVEHPERVAWMGSEEDNTYLQIAPPSDAAEWTQRPNHVEVMPGVYVGNFIAASQAKALGIDAVLNMAEELNPTLETGGAIAYLKLPCIDGSQHPIPEEYLQRAIAWIEQQRASGKQRILVHCRAGIGRSGSVGVAYCFYKRPDWSYMDALKYVWSKKPDVYPHTQLRTSLERLFRLNATS